NSNRLISSVVCDLVKVREMATISDILEDVRANTNSQDSVSETVDSSYILIDIGANLTNKKFSRDVDAVVQRAKESGVQKIMVINQSSKINSMCILLTFRQMVLLMEREIM